MTVGEYSVKLPNIKLLVQENTEAENRIFPWLIVCGARSAENFFTTRPAHVTTADLKIFIRIIAILLNGRDGKRESKNEISNKRIINTKIHL
jgi:hypothetical protein